MHEPEGLMRLSGVLLLLLTALLAACVESGLRLLGSAVGPLRRAYVVAPGLLLIAVSLLCGSYNRLLTGAACLYLAFAILVVGHMALSQARRLYEVMRGPSAGEAHPECTTMPPSQKAVAPAAIIAGAAAKCVFAIAAMSSLFIAAVGAYLLAGGHFPGYYRDHSAPVAVSPLYRRAEQR